MMVPIINMPSGAQVRKVPVCLFILNYLVRHQKNTYYQEYNRQHYVICLKSKNCTMSTRESRILLGNIKLNIAQKIEDMKCCQCRNNECLTLWQRGACENTWFLSIWFGH